MDNLIIIGVIGTILLVAVIVMIMFLVEKYRSKWLSIVKFLANPLWALVVFALSWLFIPGKDNPYWILIPISIYGIFFGPFLMMYYMNFAALRNLKEEHDAIKSGNVEKLQFIKKRDNLIKILQLIIIALFILYMILHNNIF